MGLIGDTGDVIIRNIPQACVLSSLSLGLIGFFLVGPLETG